jgi:hypothetical protein
VAVLPAAVLAGGPPRAGADDLVLLYPLAGLVILTLSVRLVRSVPTPPTLLLLAAAVWLLASGFVPVLFGYPVAAVLLETRCVASGPQGRPRHGSVWRQWALRQHLQRFILISPPAC